MDPYCEIQPTVICKLGEQKAPSNTRNGAGKPITQKNIQSRTVEFLTSLPVTSCVLALLLSTGANIHGSLWLLNYCASVLITLMGLAIMISSLNSHSAEKFCEAAFFVICSPLCVLSNVYPPESSASMCDGSSVTTRVDRRRESLKHLAFITCALLPADLSCSQGLYILIIWIVYRSLSDFLSANINASNLPWQDGAISRAVVCGTVIAADFALNGLSAVIVASYVLSGNLRQSKKMEDILEALCLEVLEGHEIYLSLALLSIAQLFLSLSSLIILTQLSIVTVVCFSINMYLTLVELRQIMNNFDEARLCLSAFPPASTAMIAKYDDVCAICLGSMSYARVLPCKHIFHGRCLKDCLSKKHQCPMCNTHLL